MAYFSPIDRRLLAVETKTEQFDPRISYMKNKLDHTDIYIERYLPVKIYNMIYECHKDSLLDFGHRKEFLTSMKSIFNKIRTKVLKDESGVNRNKCQLKKTVY